MPRGSHARQAGYRSNLTGRARGAYNADASSLMRSWFRRIPYPALCALLGLALGWVPALFHGPISYKFNVLGIRGAIAVWGFYVARLSIGYSVGVTRWPAAWWLRGPLCGFLAMFPLTFIVLATPGCGGL